MLALVRVAKGMGGSAPLMDYDLSEAPWDLITALNQALVVLSWYENLPKDEQPPRWIWWSEKLLDEWFKEVTNNRKSGKKTNSYQRADDVPMSDNSMTDDFRPVFVDA